MDELALSLNDRALRSLRLAHVGHDDLLLGPLAHDDRALLGLAHDDRALLLAHDDPCLHDPLLLGHLAHDDSWLLPIAWCRLLLKLLRVLLLELLRVLLRARVLEAARFRPPTKEHANPHTKARDEDGEDDGDG